MLIFITLEFDLVQFDIPISLHFFSIYRVLIKNSTINEYKIISTLFTSFSPFFYLFPSVLLRPASMSCFLDISPSPKNLNVVYR